MNQTTAAIELDPQHSIIHCSGIWTISNLSRIQKQLKNIHWPTNEELTIDGSRIVDLDSAGSWLLQNCLLTLEKQGKRIKRIGFSEEQTAILNLIYSQTLNIQASTSPHRKNILYTLGIETLNKYQQALDILTFMGELFVAFCETLMMHRRFAWRSFTSVIQTAGYNALPLIATLSFLVGIVLTYPTVM